MQDVADLARRLDLDPADWIEAAVFEVAQDDQATRARQAIQGPIDVHSTLPVATAIAESRGQRQDVVQLIRIRPDGVRDDDAEARDSLTVRLACHSSSSLFRRNGDARVEDNISCHPQPGS